MLRIVLLRQDLATWRVKPTGTLLSKVWHSLEVLLLLAIWKRLKSLQIWLRDCILLMR